MTDSAHSESRTWLERIPVVREIDERLRKRPRMGIWFAVGVVNIGAAIRSLQAMVDPVDPMFGLVANGLLGVACVLYAMFVRSDE